MLEIFLWISLLAVLRIGYQIIQQRRCPDNYTLKNLTKSRWKNTHQREYQRVISHLGLCEKCTKRLEEINFGKNLEDHLVD